MREAIVHEGAGTLWLPRPHEELDSVVMPGVTDAARFYMGLQNFIAKARTNTVMLKGLREYPETVGKFELKLHIGNPGTEGKTNVATENTKKICNMPAAGENLHNEAAIEWVEVKAKETYSFFSLWGKAIFDPEPMFLGYGEFTVPIAVEIGDTFKINKEALTITVE